MLPGRRNNLVVWLCLCDCGKEHTATTQALRWGGTKSCGCMKLEILSGANRTHGKSKTTEYGSWHSMTQRCINHHNKNYHQYGGRGILVFPDWVGEGGFEPFLEYIGPKPSPQHTLDRYPDMNGNYEPGNVRWATKKEQSDNRRNSRWLECDGKKMVMGDWAKYLNVPATLLCGFLRRGGTIEKAVKKYKDNDGGGLTYLNQARKRRFYGNRSKTSKYAKNILTFHPAFKVWYQISMYAYYSIADKKEMPMAMATFYSDEDPSIGNCHSVSLVDKSFNDAYLEAQPIFLVNSKKQKT